MELTASNIWQLGKNIRENQPKLNVLIGSVLENPCRYNNDTSMINQLVAYTTARAINYSIKNIRDIGGTKIGEIILTSEQVAKIYNFFLSKCRIFNFEDVLESLAYSADPSDSEAPKWEDVQTEIRFKSVFISFCNTYFKYIALANIEPL
jgi:hypothetical protein